MIVKEGRRIQITIPEKFSEKQIGNFMNIFCDEYSKLSSKDIFYFDFTQTEWIANQNLLLLSSLIKYIYKSGIKFKIKLFPNNLNTMSKRQATQICQLWDVWKLYLIFDETNFDYYIDDFENSKISYLYQKFGINKSFDLFDRFSVIPFISLNYIENHTFENTNAQLKPVYALNEVINNELYNCGCEHPFTKRTISAIITRELYDNFLDHFNSEKSLFHCTQNWAFMSIALKRKRKEDNQYLFKTNFEEEEIQEAHSFFCDTPKGKYHNENLIQFSFIDFGSGIVDTLLKQYKEEHHILDTDLFTQIDENDVLEYAFRHNTSRNPIFKKFDKDQFITRGLFDLVAIVKRYKGLLIVRSNKGKILYNFAETDIIKDAVFTFDKDKEEYFPGTYISIYIPALKNDSEFDESVIDIQCDETPKQYKKPKNINVFSEISELDTGKNYNQLFEKLFEKLKYHNDGNYLTYISFWGVNDDNIIHKIILLLAGNIEINKYNRIIIVYPPDKKIIENINHKISTLDKSGEVLKMKIHPIPCIYYDIEQNDVFLEWIGITNESDKKKLNDLLYEEYSLAKSDLEEPYKAIGNTNKVDIHGNISATLPTAKNLLSYYENYLLHYKEELKNSPEYVKSITEEAIYKFECKKEDGLYLCNGNYYQEKFLQLTDVLNDKRYRDAISLFLLEKIRLHINKEHKADITDIRKDVKFIAITASSHKILDALIRNNDGQEQTLIDKNNCLCLDSYLNFEDEIQNKLISGSKYVLVCDAIATGRLTKRLDEIIKNNQAELIAVAVIANTLDANFEGYKDFENEFIKEERFIELLKYPINKIQQNNLTTEQKNKQLIRINPYTNIPITFSDDATLKESILLSNNEFLECIENEDIEIRFKLFNNLVHPYFFKTAQILQKEYDKILNGQYEKSIVKKIFDKVKEKGSLADYVFYPKNSDIEYLKLEDKQIESKILQKGGTKFFELERYNPGNGWKFPHTTDYFKKEILNKDVLILDDGSCSGDSLYQMINELSYYLPNKITVISIIGRVEDHKREFFSKIKSIQAKDDREKNGIKDIAVNIYFGTHWHIPTFYQEENPYMEEIGWLDKISGTLNVPQKIKTNAEKIQSEIKPKTDKEIKQEIEDGKRKDIDYRFFPKDENKQIPKKEILSIRNEIGKIVGFRFYKQSFDWFDKHITPITEKNYADLETSSKKQFEELLMCFLYEPYLYKELTRVMPEIKNPIEQFIEEIIFNEDNQRMNMQYKWRRPDIVHLFFIVYQDYKILIKQIDLERFKRLLEFIDNKINYLLYKLFYYSPINKYRYKDIFAKIKTEILVGYLTSNNANIDKNVKLFNYFIESLPNEEKSFEEILKEIHEEYKRISNIEFHKENVNNKIETTLNCLNALKNDNRNVSAYNILVANLEKIVKFVNKILSVSLSDYKPYFSEYWELFEGNDPHSLRNIQKRLAIFLTTDISSMRVDEIYTDISKLQKKFLTSESIPYKIFHKITIENVVEKLQQEKNNNENDENIKIINNIVSTSAYFPEYIFENIVLKNIFRNLEKYADKNEKICIEINDKDGKFIEIVITNKSNEQSANGGLIGTQRLGELNDCPDNLFEYFVEKDENMIYKQVITLKKI
ncbi:MAG: phosphoribosyltransferase [Prevotellaceae bacterium]|jgi:hypoxanthine-guanine phosphoribosyltransferase|nr:phosphoribosyltransferase [Prevotellaceae bacterium]